MEYISVTLVYRGMGSNADQQSKLLRPIPVAGFSRFTATSCRASFDLSNIARPHGCVATHDWSRS
jgi:hypothetical protein